MLPSAGLQLYFHLVSAFDAAALHALNFRGQT